MSKMPLTLKFYFSDSCGYCRRFSKTLDKIEQERPNVSVTKIAYEQSEHTEIKYIPTVVVSHGERELGRFSSALAKKAIDNWLDQLDEYTKKHLGE
ncbi:thioredoxin family protein [Paenibacillus sp. NPDC057967]|uniref:thioredoxin family protein n=1 Tax=Paenibacillus sp. NPDC057967 TaxID=3346293 RepID=UPI0036DBAAEF